MPKARNLLNKWRKFGSRRLGHAVGSKTPGDTVGSEIGDLHASGKIAVNEKRFGNYETGTLPTCGCLFEIAVSLVNQEMAFCFFQLVKNYDALLGCDPARPLVVNGLFLKEVEETFEKVGVIFA